MGTLTRHVSVRDDAGEIHSFGPDSGEVPEWAARQITNPGAWEDGEAPFPAKKPSGSKPAAAGAVSEVSTQDLEDRIVSRVLGGVGDLLRELVAVVDTEDDADPAGSGPPPKAGRGSGEDKWRTYAAEQGVDVTAIEDRNEIISFLDSQGIAVG